MASNTNLAQDLQNLLTKLSSMGTDPALLAAITQSLPSTSTTPATTTVTPPPSPTPDQLAMVPYVAPTNPNTDPASQNPNPNTAPAVPTAISSTNVEEVHSSPTHPDPIEEETEELPGQGTPVMVEEHLAVKEKIQSVVRDLTRELAEEEDVEEPPKAPKASGRVKTTYSSKRKTRSQKKSEKAITVSSDEESVPLSGNKAKKAKVSAAPVRQSQRRLPAKAKGKAVAADDVKDMSHKSVVKELLLDPEFLKENFLERVLDILKAQKWSKLFVEEVEMDEELLREFYSTFAMEVRPHAVLGSYKLDGKVHVFSSIELGMILGVPHEGFGEYPKGRWPKDFAYSESVLAVAGIENAQGSADLDISEMSAVNKVLYHFLISNITPRGQKRNRLLILDIVLLSLLLKKEPVCLPMILMQHMAHARNTTQHALPFPRVVKKILEYHKVYNASEDVSIFSRPFNASNLHKMQFVLQEDEGWVKVEGAPAASEGAEDVEAMEGSEADSSEGEQNENASLGKDVRSLCRAVKDLVAQQTLLMADVRALISHHASAQPAGHSDA